MLHTKKIVLASVIKQLPKSVRDDASKLYSFFDVVYSLVNNSPFDDRRFERIFSRWGTIKLQLDRKNLPTPLNDSVDEQALANIAYVVHRYEADPAWIDAYLQSMKMDVKGRVYKTQAELREYLYGSAEIIGLLMVKILKLPGQGITSGYPESEVFQLARMKARALKFETIVHAIEKYHSNMEYIPLRTLKKYGMKELNPEIIQNNPEQFSQILSEQKTLLHEWKTQSKGLNSYLPAQYQQLTEQLGA